LCLCPDWPGTLILLHLSSQVPPHPAYDRDGVLLIFSPKTVILPISASPVAGITDVNHCTCPYTVCFLQPKVCGSFGNWYQGWGFLDVTLKALCVCVGLDSWVSVGRTGQACYILLLSAGTRKWDRCVRGTGREQ
jgi:hypothetical protein